MHLLTSYALAAGAKIKKPFVYTHFYPIPAEKYISFQPNSKYNSKVYDLWQDCLDLLHPILNENGISIVQIGAQGDRQFPGCINTSGRTSINQASHIIKNSILHLGADSFGSHVASVFRKKIVSLYSNNYKDVCKPFFSADEDVILFEPDRTKRKPSFAADEGPPHLKQINEINPEDVAAAVCKLLNLPFHFNLKTRFVGETYFRGKLIETLPNQVVNIHALGVNSIIVRMDYFFNEQNLAQQLSVSKCSIVTNRPINIDLLKKFKDNILEIVYDIEESDSPEFVKQIQKLGVRFALTSYLPENALNPKKIDYMDYGIIFRKETPDPLKIEKIKSLDLNNFYFKSNKITLSNGKVYPSKFHLDNDKSVEQVNSVISRGYNYPSFWKELEFFCLLS